MEENKKGKIVVDGIEIKKDMKKIDEVRREVGMVLKKLKILKNIKIMEKWKIEKIWVRKMKKKKEEEIEMNYMESVKIKEKEKKYKGKI